MSVQKESDIDGKPIDRNIRNYHEETLSDFLALLAASGCTKTKELSRCHINKRVNGKNVSFAKLFLDVAPGSYLKG